MPNSEANAPEHYRLFIAVLIPDQIKSEMAAVQAELQTKLSKGAATWTKPEQLHVTLRFLGNVACDQVSALKEQVTSALESSSPFELQAEQVGAFPDIRFPRVLWVGLNDAQGKLTQLQRLVEGAVSPFSPQAGHEKFHAHATFGRVKHLRAGDRKALGDCFSRMSQRFFGQWYVNEVELMRSELSSHGAVHKCVASFPLS